MAKHEHDKTEYLSNKKKNSKTAVVLIAGVRHHREYSVSPAHHCTIWYRSTYYGLRDPGPGLRNPTSFLRPALPIAPTTDDKAREKRSIFRLNPATFRSVFTLYLTTNDAISW